MSFKTNTMVEVESYQRADYNCFYEYYIGEDKEANIPLII